MSRGFGWLQRNLFTIIRQHGKPMTFEDIRAVIRQQFEMEDGTKLYPSFERSLRHALHGMVKGGGMIAIGGGGRADPFRYFMDPMIIAMVSKTAEEGGAWLDALAADPGADRAWKGLAEGWAKGSEPNVSGCYNRGGERVSVGR
jgi:hypothetical protein